MSSEVPEPVELWAGPECSLVRVGDAIRDQLDLTCHADRLADLDVIAALGIKTVRYPVLWERVAPDEPGRCDWRWTDRRLGRLRDLGLRPIAGLLHHGSGPRWTGLLDPAFPEHLAAYAGRVAERYPWIDRYTPVNEPLTTARFAALYGLWHPHARDDASFVAAVLNQCRGTVLAMAAVRLVNPRAHLVHTEDLGRTDSTLCLRYQAEFENWRRWLTCDLLCGRVTSDHPLWSYLLSAGAGEGTLRWFEEMAVPPDVLGFNHYLTSERFLDHQLERYPPHIHGGNHRDRYADVEALRVVGRGVAGPQTLLAQAWERYRRPLAITEVHLAGTREEQLRWLVEVWNAATGLRRDGADVRAVTLWSAFGAVDWHCLLERAEGCYESGIWDVRAPRPRPTVLAQAAEALAAGRTFDHPVLDSPGWWHRPIRFAYPAVDATALPVRPVPARAPCINPRLLLIAGATGTLGRAFAALCVQRGLAHRLLTRRDMDIADPASVARALDRWRPWAIINAAGYVRVDQAERDRDACWRENVIGPEVLAHACAARGTTLVTFSSDLVFDGGRDHAYVESDGVAPSTVYGLSKVAAEQRVGALLPGALIVRTSAFFGPWDVHNLPVRMLRALASGEAVPARADLVVSPTYVPDLVHATLDLLIDRETGVWHLANTGALSWYDLAVAAARMAGINAARLMPATPEGARPCCTALASERGWVMPSVEHALARFIATRSWQALAG